ncbi:unnamed protein product [Prorocentrum cordatum]|uniref:ABC transporter domain-containing protein n=1 Tax=Prorocentrum cordatum TaxID=2364126 RepID=A0ABN9VF71_9DINO|nr:unnamed protein product [Polarella glacialis]
MVNQVREVGGRLSSMIGERSSEPAASTPSGAGQTAGLLCDCTFTLACGAATLLVGANLRLERGRIYGFVGGNDSGKSTILRAIHERRVSDFPPMEEVVTTLVEHGVGEKHPECEMTPVGTVADLLADEMIRSLKLSEYEVARALGEWGFQREGRLRRPIRTLSGGWRMKLGLARAMLQSADLLLLDEPTGHLDVEHIAWLAEYVQGLRADRSPAVSTLIVSHDSSFLDRVCTDIIHVDGNRLHAHAGDFSSFLAKVPDARLGTGSAGEPEKVLAAFTLPEPGHSDRWRASALGGGAS